MIVPEIQMYVNFLIFVNFWSNKKRSHLAELVTSVPQIIEGTLKSRLLFRVDLSSTKFINLKSHQPTAIVEFSKPKRNPPHCWNCHRLGHTKKYCLRSPRSVKCREDYTSIDDQYPLERNNPCTCANCTGLHLRSPAFQKLRQPNNTAIDEMCRRT